MTTIEVNYKHIRNGKQDNEYNCPVALAIKDRFPKCKVIVRTHYCGVYIDGDKWYWFNFDDVTQKRIRLYDTRNEMEPFSLKLKKGTGHHYIYV